MEKKNSKNACPVCGQATKENDSMIYCDNCGFNVKKQEIHPPNKCSGYDHTFVLEGN